MKIETLKVFLDDEGIQKKYGITQKELANLSMTSRESNPIIMLVRELIIKQEEANSNNIAAAQLNTLLDNRLK